MLDLIALLCLISVPLLVVVSISAFIASIISMLVKDSDVKIVEKDLEV